MTEFQKKCEEVSQRVKVSVMFFPAMRSQEPFEDDGNLHIIKEGIRACFDVGMGQLLTADSQNENTRLVLTALGESTDNDRVYVEGFDEDEDHFEGYCDHCGRGY